MSPLLFRIYQLLTSLKEMSSVELTLSVVSLMLKFLDLFNVALRTSLKCFCPYLEQRLIEFGK